MLFLENVKLQTLFQRLTYQSIVVSCMTASHCPFENAIIFITWPSDFLIWDLMVKTFIKAQKWTVFLFHFWYWVKRCCFVICFNCFFFCIYYLFVISIDIYLYICLFFPLHINDSFFKLLQNWSLHLHSSHLT